MHQNQEKKKTICFILDWYPTEMNNGCVFARHLIHAIADQGYPCVVIAPRALHRKSFSKVNRVACKREDVTAKGNRIPVYMPFYLHMSSHRKTIRMSMNHHLKAVLKTIKKYDIQPDVLYGHFLYQCGLSAARAGKRLGIPAYCACGENALRLSKGSQPYDTGLHYASWRSIANHLSGIICVSGSNRDLLLQNHFVRPGMRMDVFPNAVDASLFHRMDRKECRRKLGFPEDAFIVAFTGAFSSNKGVDRLSTALKGCEDVYSVFMGRGAIEPDCENILFSGSVENKNVALYLNAADVFCLPTRGEGCCNAIVEALACGLPIISSDLPFNDDLLTEKNAIRLDVEDVDAIRNAILLLKEDCALRQSLAEGALETAKELEINRRAENIIKFMEL